MNLKPSYKNTDPEMIRETASEQPFTGINFIMMGCCVALIVAGFLLMAGGGSSEDSGFNPDIFSTRRIVVGPALSFLGFLLMAWAILYRPSGRRKDHDVPQPDEKNEETGVTGDN